MEGWSVTTLVASSAFVIGLVFGAIAQKSHFCTMGAISDAALFGSWRRMRAWLLAIATAMLTSQILHLAGVVDLRGSIYLAGGLGWLGALLGGFLFGFGMVLAGGCVSRNLVRLGGGSLKALATLMVVGVVAFMTMSGLLALPRLRLEAVGTLDLAGHGIADQGLGALLAAPLGLSPAAVGTALAVVVAVALAAFCFKNAAFRRSPWDVAAGLVIGLLIALGWLATGWLGADDFDPVPLASLTFVAPTGQSLLYLMTYTGATIGFGVASVGGVAAGALLVALATGRFRLEAFTSASDMGRNLAGGALMGFGGVLALGCTIGQGITGLSTLALGSLLAFVAIVAGALVALRYLESGSLAGTLRMPLGGARGRSPALPRAVDPCAAALPSEPRPAPSYGAEASRR